MARLQPTFFKLIMARGLVLAVGLGGAGAAWSQDAMFERPPVHYSTAMANDAGSRMAAAIAAGKLRLPTGDAKATLRAVLAHLGVPEWSQVLVFSKTSKQIDLIHPGNPRAIYFSDDVYVGYVPGGLIEIAASDPQLGMVFHTIDASGDTPTPVRDNSCLSCHATARTERVPGVFVRSVFTNADGRPLLQAGSFDSTGSSPLGERWGGWYVTGKSGEILHMGNGLARETRTGVEFDPRAGTNQADLQGKFPGHLHLRPDSDIVALLVLEHQCEVHNVIHRATLDYRRALWMAEQLHPGENHEAPGSSAHQSAARAADDLVRALLLTGEAELGEGLQGGEDFARGFTSLPPVGPDGQSLRQFRLFHRLFKLRCSYMIYSPAFRGLPSLLKRLTLEKLASALRQQTDDGPAAHLPIKERGRILEVLQSTVPDWPEASGTIR